MSNDHAATKNLYVAAGPSTALRAGPTTALRAGGNDAWSGTLPVPNAAGNDGPFATLARARDAIRTLKSSDGLPSGGVTVTVRGGEYPLAESLAFAAEDSGTVEAPVVYQAAEGETVRLIGGRRLDPAAFKPVTDPAVRARLGAAARDRVVQADLRALGIAELGALASRGFGRPTAPAHLELFFNDRAMTVAQWPDAGAFARIAGYTRAMTNEWGQESGALAGGFTYEGDRPKHWAPSDDIWVHGYWAYDWANSYERVRRLDPEARVVETAEPHGHYHFTKGQRFYFLNVLEELDQPGEYYVDRVGGILYFWPPSFALRTSDFATATSGKTEGKPASFQDADILVSVREGPLLRLDDRPLSLPAEANPHGLSLWPLLGLRPPRPAALPCESRRKGG